MSTEIHIAYSLFFVQRSKGWWKYVWFSLQLDWMVISSSPSLWVTLCIGIHCYSCTIHIITTSMIVRAGQLNVRQLYWYLYISLHWWPTILVKSSKWGWWTCIMGMETKVLARRNMSRLLMVLHIILEVFLLNRGKGGWPRTGRTFRKVPIKCHFHKNGRKDKWKKKKSAL